MLASSSTTIMNAMLLRNLGVGRSGSLQSFTEYRASEAQNPQQSSVTSEGALLEYETLELRIHPPNVQVDNEAHEDITVITVDSANRPGTLVEVVQCLTEMDLSIRRARISSDGGWFVDEFYVSEIKGNSRGKVTDQRKVAAIKKVLNVDLDNAVPAYRPDAQPVCTVFQAAGRDKPGLLANVLQLVNSNGCDVLSAAVWTYHNRVALVVAVADRGRPLADSLKLERLQQVLADMLGKDDCLVNFDTVKGDIHHERRLHHLLLLEEDKSWRIQNPPETEAATAAMGAAAMAALISTAGGQDGGMLLDGSVNTTSRRGSEGGMTSPNSSTVPSPSGAAQAAALAAAASSGNGAAAAALAAVGAAAAAAATTAAPSTSTSMTAAMAPAPTATLASELLPNNCIDPQNLARSSRADVKIQHSPLLNYWLINIRSKDRNKLFFDTVCALSDMNYDVFHATIDSEGDIATQLFYVRPRYGTAVWDEKRAAKLKYMLESCVQRRFPRGAQVAVDTADRSTMPNLFGCLSESGFCITRADVRTLGERAWYQFTLTDAKGNEPEPAIVQAALEAQGGAMVETTELNNVAYGAVQPPGRSHLPRAGPPRGVSHKFSFSVSCQERRWGHGGGPTLGAGTVIGN